MHKVPIKITIQNEYTKYPLINLYHYIDFKLKGALYFEIQFNDGQSFSDFVIKWLVYKRIISDPFIDCFVVCRTGSTNRFVTVRRRFIL